MATGLQFDPGLPVTAPSPVDQLMGSGAPAGECIEPSLVNSVLRLLKASQARANTMRAWQNTANANQAVQIVPPNPDRVSVSIVVPTGSDAFMGDNLRIVAASTYGNQGFRILNGSTWIFGPEYIGPVYVIMNTGASPTVITALELSATAG